MNQIDEGSSNNKQSIYVELLESMNAFLDNDKYKSGAISPCEQIEKHLIIAMLIKLNGNQSNAAKILGISRGTLRNKLSSYLGTTKISNTWLLEVKKLTV